MEYTLTLEHFQGPLDKLLELVEEKEFDINFVNLAKVTGGFLKYITTLEREEISNTVLADFLVVASKLILLKSKMLIPTLELSDEEEQDVHQLEIQLKTYRTIKEAQNHVKSHWNVVPVMRHREFLMNNKAVFYPPRLTSHDLYKAFTTVVEEIGKFKPIEFVRTEIINLQNKIEELLQRITEKPTSLAHLRKENSKKELIALFLAILHLLKDEVVSVEQQHSFGDIVVAKKKGNR